MDTITRMLSEKGKTILVMNNYKFRERLTLKSGETLWTCIQKTCNEKLYTTGPGCTFSRKANDHVNHQSEDPGTLNRQKINNSAKVKAANKGFSEMPRQIIREEVKSHIDVLNTLTHKDMTRIGKNLNRAKLMSMPKLPTSLEQIHTCLEHLEIKTVKEERFLLTNDISQNVIIFTCNTNLKILCSVQIVMVDGTFDHCTKFFKQMFTLIGYINNVYIPLAFCLLKDKKERSYTFVLSKIKEECLKLNLIFNPKIVVSDFEQSILNSVRRVFPETKLVGCRFHLKQSWWRKIASLGLTSEYKNQNSEVGKWLHHTFGLSFLPPSEVENAFLELMGEIPQDSRVIKFADYLVENYIDDDVVFPTTLWAALDNSVWRTNNGSEAFNSKFSAECRRSHPNIFEFLDYLQNMQVDTYSRINYAGKNENHVKKDGFIEIKINQFLNKEIDGVSFVKSLSYR